MKAFAVSATAAIAWCLNAPKTYEVAAFSPGNHHRHDGGSRTNAPTRSSALQVAKNAPPSLLSSIVTVLAPSSTSDAATSDDDEECPFPASTAQLSSPGLVLGTPLDAASKRRNKALVHALKSLLFDGIYGSQPGTIQRSYARFYALETIARMPYFGYVSVLHLLETLGIWRKAEYLKLHFAESWNEHHHLLILEELMHGPKWHDRFVAQHVAFFYYWIVVGLYLFNPLVAYNLNQAVEEEAYDTYHNFLIRERDYLLSHPAPQVAQDYYTGRDLYLFDAMHHELEGFHPTDNNIDNDNDDGATPTRRRRPVCETLYDTFTNIRDDELEHVKTMAYLQGACQDGGGAH